MYFDKEWIESMLELQRKSQEVSQGYHWPKEFVDMVMQTIQNSSGGFQGFQPPDYSQGFKDLWNIGAVSAWEENNEPKINITESSRSILVKANIPGVKDSSDISIRINGNIMTISGKITPAEGTNDQKKSVSFSRNISLPTEVKKEGTTARYKDGILTVQLLKVIEDKSQQIDVKFL